MWTKERIIKCVKEESDFYEHTLSVIKCFLGTKNIEVISEPEIFIDLEAELVNIAYDSKEYTMPLRHLWETM